MNRPYLSFYWKAADLEATPLRNGKWAVRPIGQLGTNGFHPFAWTVIYVRASDAKSAIQKALNPVNRKV